MRNKNCCYLYYLYFLVVYQQRYKYNKSFNSRDIQLQFDICYVQIDLETTKVSEKTLH